MCLDLPLYPMQIHDVKQSSPEFLALQTALAGEYSLQRELGRGGMGVVYLARDVHLDRDVAIKVLPPDVALAAGSRDRFLREARTAAGLSHPHIVPIHRVGEAGGFVFFVMAFVDGETLGERLRRTGPLSPADATRLLREVAWALAYAHGRGVVHRDVKPDNILLEAGTGRALVTDFGIAQAGGDAIGDTVDERDASKVAGTVHFMSPEQAANAPVDGRSDLYALGVVGYLAVSGRLPFEASSLHALVLRQATERAPSVLHAAPGLPTSLGIAIDQCLAPQAADRFPNAETLASALAPVVEARPTLAPSLRAWLQSKNPLLIPYLAWGGGFGALTTANLIAWVTGNRPDGPADIVLLAAIAAAPLLPVAGFHVEQARRQFRAGFSLADLRGALEVDRRERAETEAITHVGDPPVAHRALRVATILSASSLAVMIGLLINGTIHERTMGPVVFMAPVLSTLLLGAVSNALGVAFIPRRVRAWWQSGLRERLWKSRTGAWLAKRMGAPERSVSAGAFRATEAALGVAAAELFAALPATYREELRDLPATIEALEARAAEARAEMDLVAALDASASRSSERDADILQARRAAAIRHLTESVAALERVRLDLLRLHAGANDLAPLTTLIDAARLLGDDVRRLADAQNEVGRLAVDDGDRR
jgi:serine/threonine-protein kinase